MYLNYQTQNLTDFSDSKIEEMYSYGFVMTRIALGEMNETRSLRIDLSKSELTSENRRILRKCENLKLNLIPLPVDSQNYDWQIHKTGKDFYKTKFDDVTFSAAKIKELVTSKHNFNSLFEYNLNNQKIGWCISLTTENILHYCYPFYKLDLDTKNLGMGMMLKAILWAQEKNLKYVYLGSIQRDSDKYKLQFRGLELWNHENGLWDKIQSS